MADEIVGGEEEVAIEGDGNVDSDNPPNLEPGDEVSDEGENSEDEETSFWKDLDKQEGEGQVVSTGTHIRIKDKLKGRIKERDSEIEALRKELEEVKAGRVVATIRPLKRPKEEDFDTPEEYDAAIEMYEEQRHVQLLGRAKQEEQAKKSHADRAAAVDSHYKRAEEFVVKFGIAPEKYKSADESIRKAIDTVLPGQGEVVTDHLISLLGEGSEKVLFRVGAKPEVLREFQSLLVEDKSGLKAGIFLGRQLELITNPKKRTSNAPPPSRQLKGDAAPNANAAAMKKIYQEAHKKGEAQKAFDIRQKARAAGVNVSTW